MKKGYYMMMSRFRKLLPIRKTALILAITTSCFLLSSCTTLFEAVLESTLGTYVKYSKCNYSGCTETCSGSSLYCSFHTSLLDLDKPNITIDNNNAYKVHQPLKIEENLIKLPPKLKEKEKKDNIK